MDKLNINSKVKLNNGVEMLRFGLGTFQAEQGESTRSAVRWALEAGYRSIDTATAYGNEADVGQGIRESGVPREEIFITTKLWNSDQGYDSGLRAFDTSLKRLGLDYLDLYLIHWPLINTRADAWRALVRLYEEKRVRAIGVSNYTVRFLEKLLASSPVVPAVNQFEISPFLTRQALVEYCQAKGIQVESYSPLARGRRWNDPLVNEIAQSYNRTPAQVMIRWSLEKGYVVIPKSVKRERIIENASVFDFTLSAEDVQRLDGLNENARTINPPWMRGEWEPTD
ncbi:MAG: aldo/keto reductase [Chloroflexi bacterium]|nr:MAG: aldo/keto reductase [Chloroflexota bacterium]